jgi:hypothetical protein
MTDGFTFTETRSVAEHWTSLSELMDASQTDLAGESSAVFAPTVQGAAAAFFSTWASLVGESSTIASGFVGALRTVQGAYLATDESTASRFAKLDGRLGPSR